MTLATPAADAWQAERGRLIGIAYRMLGDYGHAEDVVSEVAIEALGEERTGDRVRSWPAWLTTVCVRRSIDRVRSLAAAREDYTGHWLPEPVATDRLPEDAVADREMLSLGLLHLAEQLAPDARAAVVLHRAYGMPATEIAGILEKSPAAVRQLISRGERRLRLTDASSGMAPDAAALDALISAITAGDVSAVVTMLTDDAILWSDGGGRVQAALNPIFGREKVGRFLVGVLTTAATDRVHPLALAMLDVNGEPALGFTHAGRTDVVTLEFDADARICGIRLMANPDKLHHVLGRGMTTPAHILG